jgi:hypothetical protein
MTEAESKHAAGLPECLRPVFHEMCDDYRFYALVHCRRAIVSYRIIADMVKCGWRNENDNQTTNQRSEQ